MPTRLGLPLSLAVVLSVSMVAGCGLNSQVTGGLDRTEFTRIKAQVADEGRVPVAIDYQSARNLQQLVEAGFDLWGTQGLRAKGTVNPATLAAIEKLDLSVTRVPAPRNSFDKGYRTTVQIEADLAALAQKYPRLARLEDFGDSWLKRQGKKGHDLWVLKLGTGDAAKKPGVIFMGNHHAREIVTPEIVLNLAHTLLEGYGQDPEITRYVDEREIWLVPTVNPDGHDMAERGDDQRKNANNLTGGKRRVGVDLNRNYGFQWGTGGASTNPENDTFMGSAAGSEPEVQAVQELIKSRKFTFLMTYHSFSNLILWPWGYTDAPPPDKRMPAIGQKLGQLTGYTPEQSKDLYRTSGDTTDWAFGELGVLSYTTEIGDWNDNFDPPFASMAKFWKQNRPAAMYLLKLADDPAAVFGPEIRQATVSGGQLTVSASQPIARAEAFVGRLGAPGTGLALAGTGQAAKLRLPANVAESRQLVLVRAQGSDGQWGPVEALWSR